MPRSVFHYTSRRTAQDILISGRIKSGPSGKIWLTDEAYPRGMDAAEKLAITGKVIEVVLVVPEDSVAELTESRKVLAVMDPDTGSELRPGGGFERTTTKDIDITGAVVWPVGWP